MNVLCMINLGRLDFWVNNKTISQSQESQQLLKEIQKQPPDVFCKKGVLKNFAKFTGKHLWQNVFFNKVTGLRQLFHRTPQDDCFWKY